MFLGDEFRKIFVAQVILIHKKIRLGMNESFPAQSFIQKSFRRKQMSTRTFDRSKTHSLTKLAILGAIWVVCHVEIDQEFSIWQDLRFQITTGRVGFLTRQAIDKR